jgi:hypothetical protein
MLSSSVGMIRRLASVLFLILLMSVAGCRCGRETPQGQEARVRLDATPTLATAENATEVTSGLAAVAVTAEAVSIGSRVPLDASRVLELDASLREQLASALSSSSEQRRGVALSVDRESPFALGRRVMAVGLDESAPAVEVRVSRQGGEGAFRICALSGAPTPSAAGDDCWGRTRPTAPAPSSDAGPASDDTDGAPSTPQGDIANRAPRFDLSTSLDIVLSIEPDYLLLRVQGRSLRSLAIDAESTPGAPRTLGQLRQTLAPLRQRNDWDHRVTLRCADGVLWRDFVAVVDALASSGFTDVSVSHIAPAS